MQVNLNNNNINCKGNISFQYSLNHSGDLNDKEIWIARHYKSQGNLK